MKLTQDNKLYIPDSDNWWWREGYENKQFLETMKHVPNKGVAIDVGAHVGIWTRRLAKIFTKVHAFEPVPDHVECWKVNTQTYKNVFLEQVALSNIAKTSKMKQTKHNSGVSSLVYKPNLLKTSVEIKVLTQTLDSFNLTNVDFIKIDVERHELEVLEGAENTINTYYPVIFVEIDDSERKKPINAHSWLLNKGYKEFIAMSSSNYLFKK